MRVEILRKGGHAVVDVNRRKAIRERCLNCVGWEMGEVRACDFEHCALLPFRMGRGKQDAKARANAIRAYCLWCCADQPKEVRKCPSGDCPLYPYRMSQVDRSPEIIS